MAICSLNAERGSMTTMVSLALATKVILRLLVAMVFHTGVSRSGGGGGPPGLASVVQTA